MINFCDNLTCTNRAVGQPWHFNYICKYIGDSDSDSHFEIRSKKIMIHRILSKITAYTAVITIVSVATFTVVMNIQNMVVVLSQPKKTERTKLLHSYPKEIAVYHLNC